MIKQKRQKLRVSVDRIIDLSAFSDMGVAHLPFQELEAVSLETRSLELEIIKDKEAVGPLLTYLFIK